MLHYAVRFQQNHPNKFRYPYIQYVFSLILPMDVNISTDKMPGYTDFSILQNLCYYLDISMLEYPVETFSIFEIMSENFEPYISSLPVLTSFNVLFQYSGYMFILDSLSLNIPRGGLLRTPEGDFCDPAVTISTNLLLIFVYVSRISLR